MGCPASMDREYMILVFLSFFLSVVLFFTEKDSTYIKNVYIRHSTLFILIFFIVFYQRDLDYLFGLLDGSESRIWVSRTIVVKSLIISNIALNGFFIGYAYKKNKKREPILRFGLKCRTYPNKRYLCFLAYFLFVLYLVVVDKSFLIGGYQEGRVDSNYQLVVIIQAVLVATMALYCIEYKESNCKKTIFQFFKYPFLLIILYSGVVILSGRRTEVLRVVCILIISLIYIKGWKLNYKRMALLGLSLVLAFALVGVLRSEDAKDLSSGMNQITQIESISPLTEELSGSVNTLHVAVYSIPDQMPYNLGVSFFPSFALLVPGLDRFLSQIIPSSVMISSPEIITYLYWGGYDRPYGIGSSIVADVYVSFGLLGVFIVFIILGILFRYIEYSSFMKDSSPYVVALSICVFSQIIYACRTSVSVLFLGWTYSCILIYLINRIKNK